MESDYFMNVIQNCCSKEYIQNLSGDVLLIYSPTSMKKMNLSNNKILMENWHSITKSIEKIECFINQNRTLKEVVSFGGGSTIDIGKYIAYKLNVKFTCIPTMLSTNSYATNKVALIKEEQKITIETKIPDKIIIDNDLLNLSKEENIYGLADVFSIYTALYDWKIAQNDIDEVLDVNIYNMAEKLLKDTLEFVNNNDLKYIVRNNMKLFEFIGTAGYITNIYGTGRPESGSEHIMAKEIEKNIDIPHGISVSVGILSMGLMQNRNITDILKAINKLKVFEKANQYGLTKKIIEKSFFELEPREDRYTIINRYKKDENLKKEILGEFFKVIKI